MGSLFLRNLHRFLGDRIPDSCGSPLFRCNRLSPASPSRFFPRVAFHPGDLDLQRPSVAVLCHGINVTSALGLHTKTVPLIADLRQRPLQGVTNLLDVLLVQRGLPLKDLTSASRIGGTR